MTASPTTLITGATDGLGRALAHHLAATGAALILHGRDPGTLERTADDIRDAHHAGRPRTVLADLADLSQVREMGRPAPSSTQTASTCSSATPASAPAVASIGQHPLDFADLMLEHGYSGTRAYGQSKLAQIMSGFELASRVPAAEVTVNSLHPATLHAHQDRAERDRPPRRQPRRRRRSHRPADQQPGPGGRERQVLRPDPPSHRPPSGLRRPRTNRTLEPQAAAHPPRLRASPQQQAPAPGAGRKRRSAGDYLCSGQTRHRG